MYTADDSENPIDALLADALILADYDPDQGPTAAERIARAGPLGPNLYAPGKILSGDP